MTPRERVWQSLNHRQPDKVAVDFGGINNSSMHVSCIDELRRHYGLEDGPVRVLEPFTMAGIIEPDLQDAIGVDCVSVAPQGTLFGFPKRDWKKWTNLDGLEVLVPGGFNPQPDGNGGLLVHPLGDLSVPASGKMPSGGVYFDAIVRQEPIDESAMDPRDNVEEFVEFTQEDLGYIRAELDTAYESGRAVVMQMPGMGLGDAAEIPGCGLKHPKGIRDFTEWYMAPLIYPDYVHNMFEMQTDIALKNLEHIRNISDDKIDVVYTCATDLSHQSSLFISPEVFDEFYAPYYKKTNDWIHKNTRWKILKHNCGAIAPLLPRLIDVGFDAINPVQTSAVGMDPGVLKREFGKDLTFWGGGVDTQKELPFGTPEEVRKQVLERCEIFGKDGGFVFNAIHVVQAKTPLENIVAMIDAVHEFNGD